MPTKEVSNEYLIVDEECGQYGSRFPQVSRSVGGIPNNNAANIAKIDTTRYCKAMQYPWQGRTMAEG